ncbi:MAG: AMP phosphorylase [Candidatus Hydrothermarchaeales archaeon]
MEKSFKTRVLDIMEGRLEVVLNEEDMKEVSLHPKDRIRIWTDHKSCIAIVNSSTEFIKEGEIGVAKEVVDKLKIKEGDIVQGTPVEKPHSVEFIKKKMEGCTLTETEYETIIKDVISNKLTEIEIAAFISALYIHDMTLDETVSLTRQIASTGETLNLKNKPIFDKHSLGGVPGNKISLIVVPIVAAAGLTIPKTSSRAITSASGTADTMEVLAPVEFNAEEIGDIVDKTNGIIAWGGGVNLAPADDIFIQVEYPLSLDPHNLAICSVMAKKMAVGAEFVAIDLPMGSGTKIKDMDTARRFAKDFIELGEKIGIKVECAVTYGDKPIGRAVGPALEAKEALLDLEGKGPSTSLLEKSTAIAGMILEAGGVAMRGEGKKAAEDIVSTGKALKKMREIIKAQGGDPDIKSKDIPVGEYREKVDSVDEGYVTGIDNRSVVQIARTAGAPKDKGAGILFHVTRGRKVKKGDTLFEIYAESEYKLKQALTLAKKLYPVKLEGMLLERVPSFTYIG